ncbi:hypothetical protein GNF18_10410 [Ligilactobacillus pobuzihii]|uniref:DUF6978 family protein n=1 Tax=Ligilactobacillus pobuzihii TaxID=449659 RepID=UPI0019D0F179|nr:hypothetical protein [Ligilactobacillus pobuzihii]MBN7275553.1 hypothetical protein [Ligilactobacillus pobuzihii]
MEKKLDLNNLNEKDVSYLINTLKYPSQEFKVEDIFNTLTTLNLYRVKKDAIVLGVIDDIEYVLHVSVSKYFDIEKRYSIHLRFKDNNEHLIRVDVGSGHHNPNGYPDCSHIDHIHIYNPDIEPHDAIAYPLSNYLDQFPNVSIIIKAFEEFLVYTNIEMGGEKNERAGNETKLS